MRDHTLSQHTNTQEKAIQELKLKEKEKEKGKESVQKQQKSDEDSVDEEIARLKKACLPGILRLLFIYYIFWAVCLTNTFGHLSLFFSRQSHCKPIQKESAARR